MTPQEENVRIQQQVNEELRAYMEAQRAATKETEKSAEIEAKVAGLTATTLQIMEKLYNAQLKYTIAMAEGKQGAAQFNDSIDAMTEATQIAAVALSLLVPGGPLIKGLVAGFTFLATQAMKTAAELQKAANLQADATYKAFSAFSKAGATGADGLTGFFNDVSRMRLNVRELDQLAGALANSAQEMAGMGGTVFKARQQFADLNQGLRKAELGFLRLGLSNAETAEASLGFMKMQNTLTLGQQKDYGKLSGAAKKYIEEQEALTRATGFTRKQQEAAQEKFMSQERFGAKLAQLEREGTEESRAMAKRLVSDMTKAAAVSDQFAQAYADSVTQMYTSDASVKGLTSTQGTLGEYLNDVLENRIKTEEESNAGFQKIFKAMDETQEMFGGSQLAGATEGFLFDMKTFQTAQIRAKNGFDVQMKDSKTEVDKLMGTISGVDEQLTRFTKDVLKKQIDQMVKEQAALNGKFSTEVAGPTGWVDMMISSMKTLTKWILSVVEVLKPLSEGLGKFFFGALNSVGKLLTGDFTGVIHDLGGATKSFTDGLIETNRLFGEAIWNAMKTFGQGLMKSIQEITGALGPVFENVGKVMSGFGDSVKNGLAKFADALVDVVRDIFKKLTALIPNFGTAIEYAQTGADAVKTAGDSVVNFVSSVFGGATAPAGGSGTTTPVSAPASTPAPASVKPTAAPPSAAPAPQGGKPSAAPAPQGGKPSAAPAPASVKPSAAPAPPVQASTTGQPNSFNASKLLDYLGQKEGKGRYDTLVGYNKYKPELPSMTVAEVLDFQKTMIGLGHKSTAVGKYQIIKDTMEYLVNTGVIKKEDIFDPNTQDRAAMQLLKRRGMEQYQQGKISKEQFADRVAVEWASMPLASGLSAHDGTGDNKASGSRAEYLAAFARDGGIFDGPKSGYKATLHGMEAVIPLKDGAVPVSMSQEFNMTATNLGELVNIMKNNVDMQSTMLAVLDEIRRVQTTTADNTGKMVAYASN